MAKLFQRQAAVTSIPGKDDVDPELLERDEEDAHAPADTKDYRTESGVNFGASRYSSVETVFIDPETPEWVGFAYELSHLPEGAKVQTQDGHILIKQSDGSWASDYLQILPEELHNAAEHGLPPMAIL